MNNQKIAKELTVVAKELLSASVIPRFEVTNISDDSQDVTLEATIDRDEVHGAGAGGYVSTLVKKYILGMKRKIDKAVNPHGLYFTGSIKENRVSGNKEGPINVRVVLHFGRLEVDELGVEQALNALF